MQPEDGQKGALPRTASNPESLLRDTPSSAAYQSSSMSPTGGRARGLSRTKPIAPGLQLERSYTEDNLRSDLDGEEAQLAATLQAHDLRALQNRPRNHTLLEQAVNASSELQHKLAIAKRQIDSEVQQLLPEVERTIQTLDVPEHQEVLYSLRIEMAELLNLPDEVDKEKFYKIVGRLQALQANRTKQKTSLPKAAGLLISKLLFSTSRCSRLLQYIDAAEDQYNLDTAVALQQVQASHPPRGVGMRRASLDSGAPKAEYFDLSRTMGSLPDLGFGRKSVDMQPRGTSLRPTASMHRLDEVVENDDELGASWGRTSFDDGQALQHMLKQLQSEMREHPEMEAYSSTDETPSASWNDELADSDKIMQPPLLCRICDCMVMHIHYKLHTQLCTEVHQHEEAIRSSNLRLSREMGTLNELDLQAEQSCTLRQGLLEQCAAVINTELCVSMDDNVSCGHWSRISNELDDIAERVAAGVCTEAHLELEAAYTNISNLLQEKRRATSQVQALRAELEDTFAAPVDRPDSPAADRSPQRRTTRITDFEVVKPISHGAYGAVVLAKKKSTGDYFAMKKLKKSHMVRKKQVEHVMMERHIMATTNNPFLVKMFYAFQSINNLFVVMEFCQGGDLASMLQNLGGFSEEMVKAYSAELVLGLIYLKEQKIVHRDLKPDNILIAADGHIKVTDFGLSYGALVEHVAGEMDQMDHRHQELDEALAADAEGLQESGDRMKRYSEVGTPHYLAPEILTGMGHSYPVDYWALGVMIYEFIYGVPPFDGPDLSTIFYKITSCDIVWHDDVEISDECRDLITDLLLVDPEERLGSSSLARLQGHPFFDGVQWDVVLQSEGVFVPQPDDLEDVSYFVGKDDEEGVTEWSFDGLEGLDASPKGWRGSDEEETEGSEQLPDFLGFSFRNLSQLKDMNLKELQHMENERLANMEQEGLTFGSSLPTTPGGSKLRSTMQ